MQVNIKKKVAFSFGGCSTANHAQWLHTFLFPLPSAGRGKNEGVFGGVNPPFPL
jgi:hypothetical protein